MRKEATTLRQGELVTCRRENRQLAKEISNPGRFYSFNKDFLSPNYVPGLVEHIISIP